MFENKKTHSGIYYTRYIASWKRMGGKIYRGGLFERWLREKEHLTEEEINGIQLLAENGKLELEYSAKEFMKEHEDEDKEESELNALGGHFSEYRGMHITRMKYILKRDEPTDQEK